MRQRLSLVTLGVADIERFRDPGIRV